MQTCVPRTAASGRCSWRFRCPGRAVPPSADVCHAASSVRSLDVARRGRLRLNVCAAMPCCPRELLVDVLIAPMLSNLCRACPRGVQREANTVRAAPAVGRSAHSAPRHPLYRHHACWYKMARRGPLPSKVGRAFCQVPKAGKSPASMPPPARPHLVCTARGRHSWWFMFAAPQNGHKE